MRTRLQLRGHMREPLDAAGSVKEDFPGSHNHQGLGCAGVRGNTAQQLRLPGEAPGLTVSRSLFGLVATTLFCCLV